MSVVNQNNQQCQSFRCQVKFTQQNKNKNKKTPRNKKQYKLKHSISFLVLLYLTNTLG